MTPDDEARITADLTDEQALGLTMFAEAAGDRGDGSSVEERIGVGCVIRNRVTDRRWPKTFRRVCLQPWQFSCWNAGTDANHVRLMALADQVLRGQVTNPVLTETLFLAGGIIVGTILDRTGGANSYYAPAGMVPPGRKPNWVFLNGKSGPEHPATAAIGTQIFYRL